ncbi:PepSY-associated TM helix domain-containing protein [Amycolatopsis roodepoortensis]|uniref:Iron-regulated membrane protein n=1 Tax=Amycolatopsis roodepoortensis TaxID=700274 RepID=A0ABR9LA13_9PSEU|nr:PepSY domain-containing protein [Amycolatopsis roodepoortensis]MBE1577491.1 putative iron-regulated membrane protein [Amycolatopsis roodepoortensis]
MATRIESTTSPPRASGWRGLFLRLHFYAGVLVGPFVLIAALTGVLYAATPQMESWIYADQLRAPVGLKQVSLADQVKAAQAANPGGDLVAVRPAPEPGDTTRVLFAEEGLGESERRAIFVDPATAQVRGDLVAYGSSGALPFRTTLDHLHRNLMLGEPGRLYSELAASWLWVVALGGLVLWVSRRTRRNEKTESERGKSVRRHGSVGLWVLLGALFLSATGLTWSAYAGENVSALRESLGWATPALKVTGADEHAGHTGHSGHGEVPAAKPESVDAMLASARAAGIDAPSVEIGLPAKPGAPWQVTEIERGWPTQVDAVAVDGTTGQILGEVRFDDYPLMAKLARWGIDAHMGVLFGWPNQIVLLLLGAGLVTLVVLGYRMWWRRRPTRATGLTFGRPIPRGQWRKAPPALVVGLLVAAAAIGWFVPLLGISLLAFLVIDLLLGLRSRGRSTSDSTDVTV